MDGFIESASSLSIKLEKRYGDDGAVRGLCLIAPTKAGHRLKLSNVTGDLFSWVTLNEFYSTRTGPLSEHHLAWSKQEEDRDDPEEEPGIPEQPGDEDFDERSEGEQDAPQDGGAKPRDEIRVRRWHKF